MNQSITLFALILLTLTKYLSDAFLEHQQFAQQSSHLRMQILNQMVDHKLSTKQDLYTESDLDLIFITFRIASSLMATAQTISGRTFMTHAIGTASCMIRLGYKPLYAAAMLAHGLYSVPWLTKNDYFNENRDVCEFRQMASSLVDPRVEEVVWLWQTLYGHGMISKILDQLLKKISDDANSIEEDDKAMIMMSICDIAEEYDNGEHWWSYNLVGRRSHDDFLKMIKIARKIVGRARAAIIEQAFHSKLFLHHLFNHTSTMTEKKQIEAAIRLLNSGNKKYLQRDTRRLNYFVHEEAKMAQGTERYMEAYKEFKAHYHSKCMLDHNENRRQSLKSSVQLVKHGKVISKPFRASHFSQYPLPKDKKFVVKWIVTLNKIANSTGVGSAKPKHKPNLRNEVMGINVMASNSHTKERNNDKKHLEKSLALGTGKSKAEIRSSRILTQELLSGSLSRFHFSLQSLEELWLIVSQTYAMLTKGVYDSSYDSLFLLRLIERSIQKLRLKKAILYRCAYGYVFLHIAIAMIAGVLVAATMVMFIMNLHRALSKSSSKQVSKI